MFRNTPVLSFIIKDQNAEIQRGLCRFKAIFLSRRKSCWDYYTTGGRVSAIESAFDPKVIFPVSIVNGVRTTQPGLKQSENGLPNTDSV